MIMSIPCEQENAIRIIKRALRKQAIVMAVTSAVAFGSLFIILLHLTNAL